MSTRYSEILDLLVEPERSPVQSVARGSEVAL
jgi:hypothetical protein